jgi:Tfp pilus assembly protein PilN
MINLLPPQLKEDYGYARRNSSLFHTLISFGLGVVGLAAIVAAGILYLQQSANFYTAQAAQVEASLSEQKQSAVEKEVQDISSSLKLAVQVLSQEVLFSQLLKQLAVVTPNKVSLSGVVINEFGGGIDVSADAADYASATQLQVNLTDPDNKIFEKADIVNITCSADTAEGSPYPCKVVVRALFAKDNPFLFINDKVTGR